tara:strand:+ start:303 stop:1319 length:1017 start_codon:yes stop_codon:yes gene_type:complete
MIKKFFIIYILLLSYSLMEGREVYGLKDSYEVNIELDGSDKASVEKGMREALKKLMIRVTGSAEVSASSSLNKLYRNPEQYINQYKLSASEEVINARFFFEGNRIRNFLSENKLPLWLSSKSTVMVYIPCELKSSTNLSDLIEEELCNSLKKNLSILSENRVVELAYPILDFRDLNYLDSLSSVSYPFFMNKIIKRYSLDSWVVCFMRNDFGVILEKAECISSVSNSTNSLDVTFNNLVDRINSKNSLVVNKKVKTNSKLSIEGVVDYLTLEKVTDELRSQIIVIDLNLEGLNKASIDYELFTYGTVQDLKNLLDINPNFIRLKSPSENRLIYKYIEI